MSEGLLSGVLPAIYSAGNYAKRQAKNIASDPLGVIQQSLGQMTDTRRQFEDLNRMAYGDPRNPAKITNQAAHDLLQRMATEQMLNMNMGVAGVVKPLKGGAWLDKTVDRMIDDMRPSYSIDDKLSLEKELKKHRDYIEQNKNFPLFDLTHAEAGARDVEDILKRLPGYTAMHDWLNKNVRNYVKNEMGTPSDPVRKLADQPGNKTHLEPDQLARQHYIEGVQEDRRRAGMPVEGMAKTPTGKSWEDIADLSIESKPASSYQNRPSWNVDYGLFGQENFHTEAEANAAVKKWKESIGKLGETASKSLTNIEPVVSRSGAIGSHPWLEKKSPNEPIYNIESGQRLNFKPVTETLLNDIFEGRLPAESLKNVSVAQAVARHSDYQKELAAQMAKLEAEQQKKNLSANVHKEYDSGHKWIELPDTMSSAENKEFCKGIGKNLGLCTQNDWAAEDYGRHDVGNRLYALIDQEGKPHAQIQTKNRHFNLRDISNLPAEDQKLISKQVTEWAQNQDEYPTHSRVERAYSDAAKSLGHQLPTDVLEIKPPSNDWKGQYSLDREEKYPGYQEKYKPYLDDFVRSGNYGDVGDLHNTNLFDLHKSTQYADDLRSFGNKVGLKLPRYLLNQEADILGRYSVNHRLAESAYPESKPIPELPEELKQYQIQPEPPVQEYRAGGAVQHFDGGGEVTSEEDLNKPFFGNPNIQRQGAIARANAAERSPLTLPDPKTYAAATTALSVPVNMANMIAGGAQSIAKSIPEAIKTGQPPAPIAARLAEKYFSENPGMQPDTPMAAEYQEKLGGLFDALHVPPVVGDLTFAKNVGEVSNPMKMMLRDYMKANPPSVGLATKDPSGKPIEEAISPKKLGINVNQDKENLYADKIISGEKTFETRDSDSLRPYVGTRVPIIATGVGPAKAIGEVYLGEPIKITSKEEFNKYRDQHLVPEGSTFDIKEGGEKWLYPVSQPIKYNTPKDVAKYGIVSREVYGLGDETKDHPMQMNMKSGDITQHNLLTQREERQIANSVELTKDELKIIKEGAKAAGVPVHEIEERVRQHKIDNPSVGDDPWAQLELSRIKQLKDKPGEYEIEYKNVPYSYDQDASGKTIKPGTTEYDTHTTSLADKLKNEVVDIYNRFRGGDEAAGNIIRQAGWYKEMRSRLRQEFGGLGDLFADLLGATSPNTPVRENWKNAVDLIRKASQGDFDALVPQWEDWYKNVETKEKALNSFFTGQLAEGKTKAAIKKMPEFISQYDELKQAREFPDELLPLKDSGKKYGFNGQNGVRALLDLFRVVKHPNADIGIGTTAPKAITFSGNLIGFKDRATIDVWAARLLQRLAEKVRVPSMAETGVSGAMLPGGTTTGQFGMGQDVFRKAVDLIRKDPELSKLDVLKNISDDDLQALIWFKEKELWTKKNWTSAAGEGGSFEFEADLAGIRDQAEVNRLRKLIDTGVATTKRQKEMAQAEIEDIEAHKMTLRSLMDQAGDSLSPHDVKAMRGHIDELNKSITRQKSILAKPDPEVLMQTKKGAQEELNTMVRPLERYQAGLSQQSADFTPANADQARLANVMQKAIYAGDDGATVMASKSMPTLGIYGAPEHSIDLEAIVRQGYNPIPLLKEIITEAQAAKQHSTFLSKVLRNDEPVDPLRHRPGVEIYFREKGDVSKIQPILDDLKKEGIQFYTVVVDGRRSPQALSGQIPPAVGVRFQLVPEFEQAFDIHDWSKLTDAEIAAEVDKRALAMADLAATVAKKVPGISNAGQYWYDTEVLFDHQYQERLNEIENSSRTPGGNATNAGEKAWGGKSIREGVKGAISGPPETTGSTGAVPSGDASAPAVDRINMSHKDVTKRVPELTEAALKVQAGLMSRAEYNDIVTKYKPIEAYKTVPVPPSPKQIISALTKTNAEKPGAPNKSEYFGVPSKVLKEGDRVGIRLDIPSYEKTNTWVVTVHGPQTGKNVYAGAGPRIGYEPVARATNVEFQVQPTGALKIATGKPKSTLATMEGSWKPTTPEEAQKLAKEYLNQKDWTQVGMDPQRHSYFYDRKSGEPLTHADEIIQVGPLVLARNARNLSKPGQFAYKHGGLVTH